LKILVLSDAFSSAPPADVERLLAHARCWAEAGEHVAILADCGAASAAHGCAPAACGRQAEPLPRNLRLRSLAAARRDARAGWHRALADLLLWLRILRGAFRLGAFDVVLCSASASPWRWAALALSRWRRRPLVLELLNGIAQPPRRRAGSQTRAICKRSLWFCRCADAIIVPGRALAALLAAQGVMRTKIEVVADGLDWVQCRRRNATAPPPAAQAPLVVGWHAAGGAQSAARLKAAVIGELQRAGAAQRFRILDLPDSGQFGLTPTAPAHADARQCVFAQGPHAARPASAAPDVCVVIGVDGACAPLRPLPALVYACIGAEVPVLVAAPGECADFVQRAGVGMLFEAQDARALAAQLQRLQRDGRLRARLSAACRETAPCLDRASRAMHMLEVLRGVVARHSMHRKWRHNRRLSGYER
jgi:glycosyltransferase involved in cell wall biosynthesis